MSISTESMEQTVRAASIDQSSRCENVGPLAKELGILRQTLYRWHEQSERARFVEQVEEKSRQSRLRKEIGDLKRLVAEQALEVAFFKGTLQKIEARLHRSSGSGEPARKEA